MAVLFFIYVAVLAMLCWSPHPQVAAQEPDAMEPLTTRSRYPNTEFKPPSSFCSIANLKSEKEIILLLFSLAEHHPGAKMFVAVDTPLAHVLHNLPVQPCLDLTLLNLLDRYNGADQESMIENGQWLDFNMEKGVLMAHALLIAPDTMYMDADSVVTAPFAVPARDPVHGMPFELGLCPHYTPKRVTDRCCGFYNAGLMWVADATFPGVWKMFASGIDTAGRYSDQAALANVARLFHTFYFGVETNYGWWRHLFHVPSSDPFQNVGPDGRLYVASEPLTSIHTHFWAEHVPQSYTPFNAYVMRKIAHAPAHRSLREWLQRNAVIDMSATLRQPQRYGSRPQGPLSRDRHDAAQPQVIGISQPQHVQFVELAIDSVAPASTIRGYMLGASIVLTLLVGRRCRRYWTCLSVCRKVRNLYFV